MHIIEVENERISLQFQQSGYVYSNKLDVLTGPNGSGKTEVLVVLANRYRLSSERQKRPIHTPREHSSLPSRVVVQTFSPFTRFPSPPLMQERLLDIYERGDERAESYVSTGLHRAYRGQIGSISRNVLEEAIFRISEFPEAISAVFQVLQDIGFSPKFSLVYRARTEMNQLLDGGNEDKVEKLLNYYADEVQRGPISSRVRRELSTRSIQELSSVIYNALEVVRPSIRPDDTLRTLELPVDLETIRMDFYHLQAFALLRRLGLISLAKCELLKRSGKIRFDIAKASSGEQQMLCSIIGLASSIRDNALVLIDEPELSLHPRRQIEFFQALAAVMKLVRGCHFIVSTHSPLMVQTAQSMGAAITQMEDGNASEFISDVTGEISVEEALIDVFDTPVPYSTHISNQIFKSIVKAETGNDNEQQSALNRLRHLENLYVNSPEGGATLQLLQDAIRLVETAEDEKADE